MSDNIITKKKYEELSAELTLIKEVSLPAVLIKIKEAREQWDISENSEYDSALSEKELIDNRIQYLEEVLSDSDIVGDTDLKTKWTQISYGSTITIATDEWKQYIFRIVWTDEANPLKWMISFESPVWSSLRSKQSDNTYKYAKVWDICKVKAPKGIYEITILKISK
jgi:transcription elongation factor GreA